MAKYFVQAGWDHAPHLSDQEKEDLLGSTPPHLRDARSRGEPTMGSGAVYAVEPSFFLVDDFRPKPWHRRAYGLDVGWNFTAAVWGAYDPDTDIIYIYDCYKKEKAEPALHSAHIKLRDPRNIPNFCWPGAIDPASRGRSQVDGRKLLSMYRGLGLKVIEADNSVEAGVNEVWGRLSSGRMKVVNTPNNQELIKEYKQYRRDEKGRIVKKNDHLLDALRYLIMTGLKIAKPLPTSEEFLYGNVVGSRNYGV
jgi:hypothetical protein